MRPLQTVPTMPAPSWDWPWQRQARATRPQSRRPFLQVVAEGGEPIHAGKEEFAKALALIKEGKPVKYEGVIGPVSFDEYGDITGPFRLWRIQSGEVKTVGEMSADDVTKLKAELEK